MVVNYLCTVCSNLIPSDRVTKQRCGVHGVILLSRLGHDTFILCIAVVGLKMALGSSQIPLITTSPPPPQYTQKPELHVHGVKFPSKTKCALSPPFRKIARFLETIIGLLVAWERQIGWAKMERKQSLERAEVVLSGSGMGVGMILSFPKLSILLP